jgi:undecaprenyl-diphosphatase
MNVLNIDILVNNFFQENYTEAGKQFFIIIAEIWDVFWVVFLWIIFSLYFYKKWYFIKLKTLLISMILGVWSSVLIKYLVSRERPQNMIIEYGWYSFPSGHSVFAILFYWLLVFLFWDIIKSKFIKYLLLIFAIIMWLLVMLSRLYLSVHFFTDVLFWFILGLIWLIFWIIFYKKFKN